MWSTRRSSCGNERSGRLQRSHRCCPSRMRTPSAFCGCSNGEARRARVQPLHFRSIPSAIIAVYRFSVSCALLLRRAALTVSNAVVNGTRCCAVQGRQSREGGVVHGHGQLEGQDWPDRAAAAPRIGLEAQGPLKAGASLSAVDPAQHRVHIPLNATPALSSCRRGEHLRSERLTWSTTVCAQAKCGVCFEEYLETNMRSTGCRHMFCKDCWRGYISASVDAGPGVLDLRCPLPDCNAAVRIVLRRTSAMPCMGLQAQALSGSICHAACACNTLKSNVVELSGMPVF